MRYNRGVGYITPYDGELQATQGRQYRFLNPYNFVRPLEPTDLTEMSKDAKLLGRCPPPPHDRFVGLNGKIICEVEAITPLFISDSEKICEQENGHKSFRFFRFDDKYALPATSLRGMIRTAFEAVTNSCFAIFKAEKKLSYRLKPEDILEWVPARVESDGNGNLCLNLLPGTSEIDIGQNPSPMYAAWVRRYNPPSLVPLSNLKNRDECAALMEWSEGHWKVLHLAQNSNNLPPRQGNQKIIDKGWLCITNQNIENKNNERYFFRGPNNVSLNQPIPLNSYVEGQYNKLIDEYQDRHKDDVKKRRANGKLDQFISNTEPAISPVIYQGKEAHLSEGDLVYAKIAGTPRKPRVDYLIPVAVGRIFYESRIGSLLLPKSVRACEKYEELCPACRMFGWVKDAYKEKPEKTDTKIRTAYKGRLVFTHGKLIEDAGLLPPTTLAILSSPEPTTTRFYLVPRNGELQDGHASRQAGYNVSSKLRGRKFYRHHGEANPTEYQRAGDTQDNQNRTVRDALKPGAKFKFTIEFTNLSPVELGALLWMLELDGKGYHRLGYAKPLGFGSIRLTVTDFSVLKTAQRYRSLANSGWETVDRSIWQNRVDQFKEAMKERYNETFENLSNVQDLFALLGEPRTDLPIHYPRSTPSPREDGKNFEWFVGNNRPDGPGLMLKLAVDDKVGLPLLNKYGKER